MRIRDYHTDLPFETRVKMKKNFVYIALFSIVMIFAGLTSAYIVSMGGTFWVKFPLPSAFYVSTALIALSSIAYVVAVKFLDTDKINIVRGALILSSLLGIGFAISQFKGYKQLTDEGAYFVGPVMVVDGRYGDYFEVKMDGQFVEVDGNNYQIKGKNLSSEKMKELQSFFQQFENIEVRKEMKFQNVNPNITLYFKDEPLQITENKLLRPNGEVLKDTDLERLRMLSWNVKFERGDFVHQGEYGKDFKIYLKGKELQYKNRSLYYQGKKLSVPLQNRLSEAQDSATSYIYVITFLHLLHILAALFYLFKMVSISFSANFDKYRKLSVRLGGIFWHFLGVLWLYLLLFLLFIH